MFNFGVLLFQERSRSSAPFWTPLEPKEITAFIRWGTSFLKGMVPKNTPLRQHFCVQKQGAYVAQHRHPIFERNHAFQLLNAMHPPCFTPPLCLPLIPRNPYFYSVFVVENASGQAPPKTTTSIFWRQNRTKNQKDHFGPPPASF